MQLALPRISFQYALPAFYFPIALRSGMSLQMWEALASSLWCYWEVAGPLVLFTEQQKEAR